MKNYGYLRVSTDLQDHGVDAQKATIIKQVHIDEWKVEHASGKNVTDRPVLTELLDQVCQEKACLVVSKLDRLGRSVIDVLNILERIKECGAQVKLLDLGMDTSTPAGEMMLTVLAAFAQFERRMISQRTKDALAAAREKGVRLGRPTKASYPEMANRMWAGDNVAQIAADYGVSERTVYRAMEACVNAALAEAGI